MITSTCCPVLVDGTRLRIPMPPQLIVGNRHELKAVLLEQLDHGARDFVLDFRDTVYLDSAGLGVLVNLRAKIHAAGGSIAIENLNDDLATLFQLTRVDAYFNLQSTSHGNRHG